MPPADGYSFVGVPEEARPFCPEIRADISCWEIIKIVNARLKQAGMPSAAQEFRRQAQLEDDAGMVFTLALHYIRIPGQEPSNG
jgi:hypothetical protein